MSLAHKLSTSVVTLGCGLELGGSDLTKVQQRPCELSGGVAGSSTICCGSQGQAAFLTAWEESPGYRWLSLALTPEAWAYLGLGGCMSVRQKYPNFLLNN
jgi:hypothetical protein